MPLPQKGGLSSAPCLQGQLGTGARQATQVLARDRPGRTCADTWLLLSVSLVMLPRPSAACPVPWWGLGPCSHLSHRCAGGSKTRGHAADPLSLFLPLQQ